ncbi:hypothetical protein JOF56_006950 [Kibdelosporangium banguiense]|uniref:Novel STAND NTPase 1 domain-containing protein n=1 Tax=Kibdelosporangium banguiense TaxID=1365924 RepID=A0ABS4TQ82_9PSEU|nr:hypothetical protein [Kibdelosporangium banguiense]MBP2326565.1 hypothetical protein [Kibdelosporangium banguiense]
MSRTSNPYIGPRAFRTTEKLPNRDREASELVNLVLAERVVLLHAPSGAGKTSLIQTSVMKQLQDLKFTPTAALRVQCPRPSVGNCNRYVFSLALNLLGPDEVGLERLAGMSLSQVLGHAIGKRDYRVIVIDQLEEILTLDPSDLPAKEEFFCQLGEAIEKHSLWALLAVREDYLGGMERFLQFIPGQMRMTYRLDFLGREDALAAVRNPALERGVEFPDAVAEQLVDRLAGNGGFVEPFQLQVVCRQLWRDRNPAAATIEVSEVEEVDIDRALGKYYSRCVADIVAKANVPERVIRDWFEYALIKDCLRVQTMRGPDVGDLEQEVLSRLEEMYLIRGDTRAQTRWYELAHDRLVGVVLENNQSWQLHHLDSWQVAAYEWDRHGRDPSFLLPKKKLNYAPLSVSRLLEHEQAFLHESSKGVKWRAKLAATMTRVLVPLVLIELVVIILLVVL